MFSKNVTTKNLCWIFIFFFHWEKSFKIHLHFHSISPTFILGSHVSLVLLPWSRGAVKHGILPKLGSPTTVTGGEDLTATRDGGNTCKVEGGLWFSTIFTNQFFTPTSAFWPQWHLCLGGWRGVIPLMQCLSWHCLGSLNPQSCFITSTLYSLYPSQMNLHLSWIAVIIGISFFFFSTLNE